MLQSSWGLDTYANVLQFKLGWKEHSKRTCPLISELSFVIQAGKRSCEGSKFEMCYFPNNFPINFREKKQVPPTLSDQPITQRRICHSRLPGPCHLSRYMPSHLHFSLTQWQSSKQFLSTIEISPFHVCLTSALQHFPQHFLSANSSNVKVPLLASPLPLHTSLQDLVLL